MDSVDGSTAIKQIRPQAPGTASSPEDSAAWWGGLTPTQRENATNDRPERAGWLDGIPATDRNAANWLHLINARRTLKSDRQPLIDEQNLIQRLRDNGTAALTYPDGGASRLAELEEELTYVNDSLGGIDDIRESFGLTEGQDQPGPDPRCTDQRTTCLLLGFSEARPTGRVIISIHNPDTADNVLSYVPGTGARLNASLGKDIDRVDTMARDAKAAAPSHTTAAILWQAYDAPQGIFSFIPTEGANDDSWAKDGGPLLRSFQRGLRRAHLGPPSSNTVLGHSYGTTLIGYAAKEPIAVDRIILLASPGVGAWTVEGLKLDGYASFASSAGRIWATRAANDRIGWTGGGGELLINGVDPVIDDFGARVFASDPGTNDGVFGFEAHSQYWSRDDASGRINVSRYNVARITTGLADCGFIDTPFIPQDRDPSVGNAVAGCEVPWQ